MPFGDLEVQVKSLLHVNMWYTTVPNSSGQSLSFRKIFHDGHVVPLQGFNVLDPSGKLGGEIRMSLIFFSITLDQVSNADQRLSATGHASPYPRRTNPVSAGAPSARRIHEPDADYASRGSTSSTTPHLLKEVRFCSNEDQYSSQDSRSPHQAYTEESYRDNDSAWSGSPNVRHKPKDQWHVQQHDRGAQASPGHHTSGGNPRHHPGQHYNPASPQITPQLTGQRSREEHVKYGVTASRLVAKPPQKLFGPNHHQLPDVHQQQKRAPPVRQQAPELEPQSQLAPSALQRRPPPGKFLVSVQPKLHPDQRISIPGELDKEGPVHKQIQVVNSQQPQHTDLNSEDSGSDSDRTANSMKSKSSDNSAKMESRRSQASPVPKIVNEVVPAIPTMKKSSQTLLNTPDDPILQSPGSRASSFQSGQSIQSPTAKSEKAPTRHHPGLDPPGSDSDVEFNRSARLSKQSDRSQACAVHAIPHAKPSSQHFIQESHSPVLQPPAGAFGQSNRSNQFPTGFKHGLQGHHLPGLNQSSFDADSDALKKTKASYISGSPSRSNVPANNVGYSHASQASHFGGSNPHNGDGSYSKTQKDGVGVYKSLSASNQTINEDVSDPNENLRSDLHTYASDSEDGDLVTESGVDENSKPPDIGQFDKRGDNMGSFGSERAHVMGGTRKVWQGDNQEEHAFETTAHNRYSTHIVDEYEAKHYIDEEFNLTQQYVGEYETSGKNEEDMYNNEHREENDDYENYEQEDEEDSEGYVTRTAVPFKGHSRALGDYPLHEQDNDEHENYEHEQEYGSEQQEHEEYEEDSLAYNSVVVVPVEGNFRSPGDYTPSGISSHANVRQTPNSNLPPPNSFSGHSRGLHLPSLSHVQTSSHQESQGRILRGQVQRYQVPLGQNYPPENSPLRNKPQQSAASQAVSYQDPNKRHQVDIVSKSTHRLLENCSIDDPSPDHAKRSQDLMPPTRGHLYQKSHPHNPPF
ncbi:hypothetical protein BDL97_05G128000 [Sphagnum fallax]|nr:hypothetical protein BDL97_05G128000 [Sphagnum fallax]